MQKLESALSLRHDLYREKPNFGEQLNTAFDSIGFTENYIDRVKRDKPPKPSLIKDAVWGMMEFQPDEMALINSPLLQRLRRVRQLGLSYLTYPSAEHSRFSHSLGVSHVVKRFLVQTELNSRVIVQHSVGGTSTDINAVTCTNEETKVVQHASLLHDTGHFPFSHVLERIFQNYRDFFVCGDSVDDFLSLFEEHLGITDPQLAECLSIAIVLSKRFKRFYHLCVDAEAQYDRLLRIALVIGGRPSDPLFPGLSSIISHSNVDADKIDYLSRDSVFCGIPVGIDSARLFFRSMFLELDRPQLIALSPEVFGAGTHREKHFIVNASGLDTVDEVVHARSTMFQRVYKHKSTLLAERLLEKAVLESAQRGSMGEPHVCKFWSIGEGELLKKLVDGETRGAKQYSGWRVQERSFPKRAIIFSNSILASFLAPPLPIIDQEISQKLQKEMTGEALSKLKSKLLCGTKLDDFENELSDAAIELRDLLKDFSDIEAPAGECQVYIVPMEQIDTQSRDHIILEGRQLNFHKRASRKGQQVAGDEVARSVGYIFTEPEWREIVQISARLKLHEMSIDDRATKIHLYPAHSVDNLEIKTVHITKKFMLDRDEVARRTGVDQARLMAFEHAAKMQGYYQRFPHLLPFEGDISTALVDNLSEFDGVGGWRINRNHCESFVSQFPPNLRNEAISLVGSFRILGRAAIRQAFSNLLSGIKGEIGDDVRRSAIVGFTPNSGSLVRSLIEQELREALLQQGWEFLHSPHEANQLLKEGNLVVFVDDNISSGSQARAQIRAFAGIERNQWPDELKNQANVYENEKVFDGLSGKHHCHIAVVVANEDGLKNLANDEICSEFCVQSSSWKTINEFIREDVSLTDGMENFLSRIGRSLLKFNKKCWSEDQYRRNSLGYDEGRALLATKFNVPTATLTPFWMPGLVDGMPWLPLVLRRGYQTRLVM